MGSFVLLFAISGEGDDPRLREFLESVEKAILSQDVVQLGKLLDSSKLDATILQDVIERGLKHKTEEVRSVAAFSVGILGAKGKPFVRRLRTTLTADPSLTVKTSALNSLGHIGKDAAAALPEILESMKSPSVEVRRAAALGVGRIFADLDDKKQRRLAYMATEALYKIEKDIPTKVHALFSLWKISESSEVIAELASLLMKVSGREAILPLDRIGIMGASAKVYRKSILYHVNSSIPDVRAKAFWALSQIGCPAEELAPIGLEGLEDKERTVRTMAKAAVASLGETAIPHIKTRFAKCGTAAKTHLLSLLSAYASNKDAVEVVTIALQDNDATVRRFAQIALDKMRSKK